MNENIGSNVTFDEKGAIHFGYDLMVSITKQIVEIAAISHLQTERERHLYSQDPEENSRMELVAQLLDMMRQGHVCVEGINERGELRFDLIR